MVGLLLVIMDVILKKKLYFKGIRFKFFRLVRSLLFRGCRRRNFIYLDFNWNIWGYIWGL